MLLLLLDAEVRQVLLMVLVELLLRLLYQSLRLL